MKWLVEDCERHSAPVNALVDVVDSARAVFSDYPFATKAVIFGSFSQGQRTDGPDVDFFLGLDSTCASSECQSMLDSLASALGRDVEATAGLKGATDGFLENLKSVGRLIYVRK